MSVIDFFALSLDANYSAFGVPAHIEAVAKAVCVIDKTAGVELDPAPGGNRLPTLTPACTVRNTELVGAGVFTVGALVGKSITFNGQIWKIISHRPRPTPAGEDAGETFLYLRRVV